MCNTRMNIQIATEIKRYNLVVLGISETHWTQAEQKRSTSEEMMMYSGHEEENAPHTQGVALTLSKEAGKAPTNDSNYDNKISSMGGYNRS
ncbi:unnamed protein product [Schistosoma margrebowiei]|uniref:Uncharacterized protein n=1 Tax=Schistosoma margrebowiei TaxID=48269 RepID=A0A183N3W4_9TREM|nr:unnamed protein product [Schistosoma margrebowiei]